MCGWTAGFYRGMARVTIPRKTVRSEAELPLRRVEPGAIRIEILEGEEPSDARFKYFGYMSGVRDVRLRGVLEHGTTFPDLIAGEYSLRMTAGTHHVAERYYGVTVAPGKTTTIKMKVVAAGTIILKVDAPRHLVEENPRYAYLHMDRLDSEPSEAQERIVPIRFLMKLDPEGGGVIAAFPKRNHGEKPPHPFVPGRYRLQIKSEEWESEPMEVELAADTETTVRARLEAVPK